METLLIKFMIDDQPVTIPSIPPLLLLLAATTIRYSVVYYTKEVRRARARGNSIEKARGQVMLLVNLVLVSSLHLTTSQLLYLYVLLLDTNLDM